MTLRGGPITNFQEYRSDDAEPRRARAFPSLHSAIGCLSLYYAWKYCRWFFPILLVFVIGLLTSTIYLRHHWVVDLIAGACLVPWTLWFAPRYERWWYTRTCARRSLLIHDISPDAGRHFIRRDGTSSGSSTLRPSLGDREMTRAVVLAICLR